MNHLRQWIVFAAPGSAAAAFASDGQLDPTFGAGGRYDFAVVRLQGEEIFFNGFGCDSQDFR